MDLDLGFNAIPRVREVEYIVYCTLLRNLCVEENPLWEEIPGPEVRALVVARVCCAYAWV